MDGKVPCAKSAVSGKFRISVLEAGRGNPARGALVSSLGMVLGVLLNRVP